MNMGLWRSVDLGGVFIYESSICMRQRRGELGALKKKDIIIETLLFCGGDI